MFKNNCGFVCLHYRKPVITNITHINSFKHHRNKNMSRVAEITGQCIIASLILL